MSSIRCNDLCKTFEQGGETIVGLDHVSLSIEEGEFVCLSGPSGSGKTTLLNAMGGLDTPDSGRIQVGDAVLTDLSRGQLADMRLQNVGFVFQAYNLVPVLSARENVEFVMQVQGVDARQRSQRVQEVLAEVGLEGLESRLPAELSGGQQQRVAVARAIASKPKLVLADEPTANLDTRSAAQLMGLFVSLNQRGITFVIATHDSRVMGYARRLVKLQDGRMISDEAQEPTAMVV
ncbi:ABC transporter ATP-binding protein [Halioglobus pacificus]|uniref:ABC transporter ATP-binding protein n=1 Tax=Parahalioglobus pacificus TaxID=930806 RepID=A0A919CM61_9GAMM|nr:ABC transporter ATP-binding protein [Halioglobus pacificus]NQY03935.1 ABC transporter ATP-binding protein [Halieaceae bacterium]GHD36366.1 ABC transporter ATP-binding protein [Halioglobus pacificus]